MKRQTVKFAALVLFLTATSLEAQPFTTLQSGYTQELWAVTNQTFNAILGGLAFASNGDLWAKTCGTTANLLRFNASQTVTTNGASLHPSAISGTSLTAFSCGMVNHPDGRIYVNSIGGVQRVDAATGAVLGAIGASGNSYGIAVDPRTNRLVYPDASCTLITTCLMLSIDPATETNSRAFATLTFPGPLEYVDGVDFDPTGNYLIVAGRTGVFPNDPPYLTIYTRDGALVRQLDASHFPDGVAFHRNPFYLITNNNDGTITRYDFPNGDPRLAPVETVIASGGYRGDLSAVGADGCFYATQAGTRYPTGLATADHSIVRICSTQGEFPPAGGVNSSDPVIRAAGVVNATGYQTKLTPDCVFTVFGEGLGPAAIALASGTNYQSALAGTSITFTPGSGGAAINARIVYSLATQVAALLPSNIPTGSYAVSLTYNGRTSAPRTVAVVARSFGIATQNSAGNGTPQATIGNVNGGLSLTRFTPGSVAFGGFTWTLGPAHAGDTLVLWGTGGGADTANDTGGTSGDQTAAGNFQVLIDGRMVKPLYAGASNGYPGLWQVNFTVPTDFAPDCFASVAVSAGGETGNAVVIPIAAAGQSTCVDRDLSAPTLTKLDASGDIVGGDFTAGTSTANSVETDTFSGSINHWSVAQWAARNLLRPSLGQCSISDTPYFPNDPPTDFTSSLDAGPRLNISGAGLTAGSILTGSVAPAGWTYLYNPPSGSISSGTYSLSGTGGSQVGAFTASAKFPGSLSVTNFASMTTVEHTQPLNVTWTSTGVDFVTMRITSLNTTASPGRRYVLSCSAAASAQSLQVPSALLAQIPSTPTNLTLSVIGATNPQPFQASLVGGGQLDFGSFGGSIAFVNTATLR